MATPGAPGRPHAQAPAGAMGAEKAQGQPLPLRAAARTANKDTAYMHLPMGRDPDVPFRKEDVSSCPCCVPKRLPIYSFSITQQGHEDTFSFRKGTLGSRLIRKSTYAVSSLGVLAALHKDAGASPAGRLGPASPPWSLGKASPAGTVLSSSSVSLGPRVPR